MDKNKLPLIVVTTVLFVGLVVIQSLVSKPKIPDAANQNNSPAVEQPDEMGAPEPPAGQPTANGNGDVLADPAGNESAPPASPEQSPERVNQPRQLLTLGRHDPEAGQLVAQIDSRGATVRRVELNSRVRDGQLKYCDVDWWGAWIGHLELESSAGGCVVNLVVPGSPAERAGIQAGETIVSVTAEPDIVAEPVVNPGDFEALLRRLDPRSRLDLTVRDASGNQRVVSVQSTRKPLEVVRPTPPDMLTANMQNRRGFQFTLKDRTSSVWPDLDEGMRTGNWKAERIEGAETETIELTWDLPVLADGRQFQVVKRYRLPADPNAFHIDMEVEIRNLGSETTPVCFELWGPTGLPTEGWWYQQKIHGNTWAIGKMAGARDILSSTNAVPFRFFSSPQIVADKQNGSSGTPIIEKGLLDPARREIRYLAGDTQYFAVALLPGEQPLDCFSAYATTASRIDENDKQRARKLTDVNFVVYSNPIDVSPWEATTGAGAWKRQFQIFAGPKDPEVLDRYGLGDARTFGWFAMFSKPLIGLLHLLYRMTFSISYGIAIVLLTVIVRSLMIPISRKAALNAQMMQHLSPEIKAIAEKYKEQPEKRIQAQQELFARYKYNPFGGCLLMFLQLPIFLGLYRGLSVDVALRDAPLIPGMRWCSNLAGPDKLFYWGDWMPSFLANETGWLGPYFNLLPILAIGLMLAQQKLFMPPATDDQSRMAQKMMKFMMVFMGFVFFKVAAGLCIYFITSSVWGIVERKMLPKPELNIEKLESRAGKSRFGITKKVSADAAANTPLRNEKALDERRQRDRQRKRKLRERQ